MSYLLLSCSIRDPIWLIQTQTMSKRSYFYFKQIVSEFSRSNKIKNSAQIFEVSLVQEGRYVCVPPVKVITSSNQLHGIMLIVNMCFPQGCASCRLSDNSRC